MASVLSPWSLLFDKTCLMYNVCLIYAPLMRLVKRFADIGEQESDRIAQNCFSRMNAIAAAEKELWRDGHFVCLLVHAARTDVLGHEWVGIVPYLDPTASENRIDNHVYALNCKGSARELLPEYGLRNVIVTRYFLRVDV